MTSLLHYASSSFFIWRTVELPLIDYGRGVDDRNSESYLKSGYPSVYQY